MTDNPRGWRRLWPSRLWLETIQPSPGIWEWKIWTVDKSRVIACSAETYNRQADCARGGIRFYEGMPESIPR